MNVTLTFAAVLRMYEGATALLDAEFTSPATSVRLGHLHRTLQPVYEDISARHNAVIEKYAVRDDEGHFVYEDEEKTSLKRTEELLGHVNEFLLNTIELSLPALDPASLRLENGSLSPAAIYPLRKLFNVIGRAVELSRQEVGEAAATLQGLMLRNFQRCDTAPALAAALGVLSEETAKYDARRRQIAEENAERDEDGSIKYVDAKKREFLITAAAAAEIERFNAEKVALELPRIDSEQLVLEGGKALSPRRLYGLMPILVISD